MIIAEEIGGRIRALRKQKKVSQEQMAMDLGMYQADISNLERAVGGSGINDLFKLEAIANYFRVPLFTLLTNAVKVSRETAILEERGASGKAIESGEVENGSDVTANADKAMRIIAIPTADDEDLFQVDYTSLAEVYRYRAMVEACIENPSVYDEADDIIAKEKAILKKLKQACFSEEAYEVWKKDYIDAKVKEVTEKHSFLACSYLFAGIGQYKELLPEEEMEGFKAWIDGCGSAFLVEVKKANKREIRSFVKMHIADELFDNKTM